jgi:hypothetical protein
VDSLTFYFDRTFGKRLPRALNDLRPPVQIHWHQEQRFPQDMPDDEWLSIVGQKRWVVLSQDRKFHIRDNEAKAIKHYAVRCFYLPCAQQSRWMSLCHIVKRHVKMQELAALKGAPFIFELKNNGQFYSVKLP